MGNSCKEATDDLPRLAKYSNPEKTTVATATEPEHDEFSVKQLNEYYSNRNSNVTIESPEETLPVTSNTGYGRVQWEDGAQYIGFLLDGKANGSGVFVYPDGSIFNGHFKEGQAHGKGTIKTR